MYVKDMYGVYVRGICAGYMYGIYMCGIYMYGVYVRGICTGYVCMYGIYTYVRICTGYVRDMYGMYTYVRDMYVYVRDMYGMCIYVRAIMYALSSHVRRRVSLFVTLRLGSVYSLHSD